MYLVHANVSYYRLDVSASEAVLVELSLLEVLSNHINEYSYVILHKQSLVAKKLLLSYCVLASFRLCVLLLLKSQTGACQCMRGVCVAEAHHGGLHQTLINFTIKSLVDTLGLLMLVFRQEQLLYQLLNSALSELVAANKHIHRRSYS